MGEETHSTMVTSELETKMRTSSATTSLPPAKEDNICVICAKPAGETLHSPSSSPSAASKPAETERKEKLSLTYLNEILLFQLTDD